MNVRQMGRAAAAVGALVAAGAAALVAVGGTANAAGTAGCTDNVNVREEPDITSKIVAVCERGQAVQVGKTSDGFVQLTDLDGWAAQEFVSVDGHTPAAPDVALTLGQPKPTHEHGDRRRGRRGRHGRAHRRRRTHGRPGSEGADGAPRGAQTPTMRNALGGLLG